MTAALVIAHPGHELRVHGWMEEHRPLVYVLTDGSGSRGGSRLESTRRTIERAGAAPGRIFGRFTDREVYRLLLEDRPAALVALSEELAAALAEAGSSVVAGDALEGFNPVHDVTRLLLNAAVRMAAARGFAVRNLEFVLEGRPDEPPGNASGGRLDEDSFRRKLAAARAYPEMAEEVRAAAEQFGLEAFRHEVLRAAEGGLAVREALGGPPFYERHGEARVAEGVYREVLRRERHLLPLVEALRERVDREVRACAS